MNFVHFCLCKAPILYSKQDESDVLDHLQIFCARSGFATFTAPERDCEI